MEYNNVGQLLTPPLPLSTLSTPDLYALYDDRWAAYQAARASYHNALRENIPELVKKYQVQVTKLNSTLDEILKEIHRRNTCAQ